MVDVGRKRDDIDLGYEEILHQGKIRIECKLEPGYYNYATGSETLALDRIAEKLCNIGNDLDSPFGGIYITLGSVVPVGFEVSAARIPCWLEVNVTAFSKTFKQLEAFENFMALTAYKIMEALVEKGEKKAAVEIGNARYIITRD